MPNPTDLLDLARICLQQAEASKNPDVAAELRRMAAEYRERAHRMPEVALSHASKQ